jgi:hypothetical protein
VKIAGFCWPIYSGGNMNALPPKLQKKVTSMNASCIKAIGVSGHGERQSYDNRILYKYGETPADE